MIDTLIRLLPEAQKVHLPALPPQFALLTCHRPSNVDDSIWLQDLLVSLGNAKIPIIFPVHPRTRKRIEAAKLESSCRDLVLLEPLPYLEFLALQKRATLVITDSGGIQEETTFLGIPCFTLRENTERPITITRGTNLLVGRDFSRLRREIENVLHGKHKQGTTVPLWDGFAGERIADHLVGRVVAASA